MLSSVAVTGGTRCAFAILKTRANEINTFYARGRSDKYRAYLPEFPCVVRGFEVSFTPATVSFSSLCRQLVVRVMHPPSGTHRQAPIERAPLRWYLTDLA